ncbi:hypothetical protein [Streptomyces sp. JB150]|uniref:DUF6907 domain-containing protein n=1 Tax=Streptomyces sp. JB150 TaxID=2714844 RepID=UPI0014083B43|nr:hypothetical protein [Streptomyces sp. JB150]QIJ61431.1 hypothetical protein G7Z13_04815 [Streptomyces sp. JB150]
MTTTVVPFSALKPGHHHAPAAIGRPGTAAQIVLVQCPDFCIEDHLAARQVAVEDIVHSSDTAHLGVKSFLSDRLALELYATIRQDPSSPDPRLRQAHIVLDDGSDDAHLTVDEAEEAVQKLLDLVGDMQRLISTARLHNAAGDSEPDMDEALRRVRGGAA